MATSEAMFYDGFLPHIKQIPVVADLPVGENLQDHLYLDLVASIEQPLSWKLADYTSWWSTLNYQFFGTGVWMSSVETSSLILLFKLYYI